MRSARSYSIVDHELYHGGYLHRLNHQAMALYLFLAVVGDRDGRSFYAEASIRESLRLSAAQLTAARSILLDEALIEYPKPHWWVRTLTPQARPARLAPPGGAAQAQAGCRALREAPQGQEPADPIAAKCRLRQILHALGSGRPR
jgi:hypothetical protein